MDEEEAMHEKMREKLHRHAADILTILHEVELNYGPLIMKSLLSSVSNVLDEAFNKAVMENCISPVGIEVNNDNS